MTVKPNIKPVLCAIYAGKITLRGNSVILKSEEEAQKLGIKLPATKIPGRYSTRSTLKMSG